MEKRVEKLLMITQQLSNLFSDNEFLQRHCMKIGRMECQLLQYLNDVKKPVCMNDLSLFLNVSHSRITRIVDNLVRKDFAQRYPSNIDRRRWYTEITENGKGVVSLSKDENIDLMNNILSNVAEDRIDDMIASLRRFIEAFDSALGDAHAKQKQNNC